jgi:hypothetical protein
MHELFGILCLFKSIFAFVLKKFENKNIKFVFFFKKKGKTLTPLGF